MSGYSWQEVVTLSKRLKRAKQHDESDELLNFNFSYTRHRTVWFTGVVWWWTGTVLVASCYTAGLGWAGLVRVRVPGTGTMVPGINTWLNL